MLTAEQIYQNKIKFIELLSKLNVDLTELTKYLDEHDYFNKPASTQYFRPYAGGLCQYALDLYYELAQLVNAYCPGKYTEEDVIKVALFKDIYKAELYEAYNRNVKNDLTGQWEAVVAYRYKEERSFYGDLPFSSFMTARKFIDLTDEQIEAIMHATTSTSYGGDIHEILRKYQLVALTRMADIAAYYLD
jgi:hypothetical protein